MKRFGILLTTLCLTLFPTLPVDAHGESKIVKHRISRVDGFVKARGTYRTSERHAHLVVTVFIIQRERVIAEKVKRGSGRRVRVTLLADCQNDVVTYAVIQGDTREGGHFASWNSRRVVCTR